MAGEPNGLTRSVSRSLHFEQNREKLIGCTAIEALDFLYLAYSPPPAMNVLLPQGIMDRYQRIHGFLLRLARVDKVISTTFVDLSHFAIHGDDGAHRTALALRFQMSAFVAALQRYVLDTAIGVNWEIMRRRLRGSRTLVHFLRGQAVRRSAVPVDREPLHPRGNMLIQKRTTTSLPSTTLTAWRSTRKSVVKMKMRTMGRIMRWL